jgi:hypothetical protein
MKIKKMRITLAKVKRRRRIRPSPQKPKRMRNFQLVSSKANGFAAEMIFF